MEFVWVKLSFVVVKIKVFVLYRKYKLGIVLVCNFEFELIFNFLLCDMLFKVCMYFDMFIYWCLIYVFL